MVAAVGAGFHPSKEGASIPIGLFCVTEEPVTPTATGMFVRTLGGTVDMVADPESVEGEPTVGGAVQGSFWLSGRVVQEQAPGSGILRRLFGSNR
jgi:hypothetical protein